MFFTDTSDEYWKGNVTMFFTDTSDEYWKGNAIMFFTISKEHDGIPLSNTHQMYQ
jgi:hypothetical protein